MTPPGGLPSTSVLLLPTSAMKAELKRRGDLIQWLNKSKLI